MLSGILCLLSLFSPTLAIPSPERRQSTNTTAQCRFSPSYSLSALESSSSLQQSYIASLLTWESGFHADGIGYNAANGMSYDGGLLDPVTGRINTTGHHPFSAASKESLQVMMYAKVLSGDPLAAIWINGEDKGEDGVEDAKAVVVNILRKKLATYNRFGESHPGFGGLVPWFLANGTELTPTLDWVNRIPGLDNGELIWAVYAAVGAMEECNRPDWQELLDGWTAWLDNAKVTAPQLFYNGTGRVCSVLDLNQSVPLSSPALNKTCEGAGSTANLNDPYEGELLTWWLYLFAPSLTSTDKEQLWEQKRPQLVALNYTGSTVNTPPSLHYAVNYTDLPVVSRPIGPITVQRGFWFSAHEQWKLLEMPYLDDPLVYRVFHNAERVRTCHSVLMSSPGLFASVNNVTNSTTGDLDGYISAAGIPSVANQTLQELDIITPYGSFPTMLFNRSVGLAWYKNMLDAPGMQNPYGSTESVRRDGTGLSSFVSWDSKVTTLVALLGGVGDLVGRKMERDGVYQAFRARLGDEYGRVFAEGNVGQLYGEDVELCWPEVQVPQGQGVVDFTGC